MQKTFEQEQAEYNLGKVLRKLPMKRKAKKAQKPSFFDESEETYNKDQSGLYDSGARINDWVNEGRY